MNPSPTTPPTPPQENSAKKMNVQGLRAMFHHHELDITNTAAKSYKTEIVNTVDNNIN